MLVSGKNAVNCGHLTVEILQTTINEGQLLSTQNVVVGWGLSEFKAGS